MYQDETYENIRKILQPARNGYVDFGNIVLYKMYTVCSTVTSPASPYIYTRLTRYVPALGREKLLSTKFSTSCPARVAIYSYVFACYFENVVANNVLLFYHFVLFIYFSPVFSKHLVPSQSRSCPVNYFTSPHVLYSFSFLMIKLCRYKGIHAAHTLVVNTTCAPLPPMM